MSDNGPFHVNDDDVVLLLSEWHSTVNDSSISRVRSGDASVEEVFRSLIKLYSSAGRFYHNLSHIKFLLSSALAIRERLADYNAVRFAIWFHDAIYDTHRTDNERLSAGLAVDSLRQLDVPDPTVRLVREMIVATERHEVSEGAPDLGAFLDLDLSILGGPRPVYELYSAAIRKEYAWVPGEIYNKERTRILNRFLEREIIFFTKEARERLEEQARLNLAWEIESIAPAAS